MTILTLAAFTAALATPNTNALESRVNTELGLLDSDIVSVELIGQPGEALNVMLPWQGAPAVLELQPHSVLADNFRLLEDAGTGQMIEHPTGPITTLRGQLLGVENGEVAASWLEDGLHARIRTQGSEFWMQPISGSPNYVIYETCDVTDHGRSCGSDLLPNNLPAQVYSTPGSGDTFGGSVEVAELACDADFEYFQDYGTVNNVNNRIQSIVNAVNLQYESEVSIRHDITTIIVRTNSNDPYSSNDAVTLLNQFRNHWQSSQGGVQRDVAELFTGKNISGGTIGIAWLGGVCNSFGYNLVESDFNGNFSCATDLTAHELGHNWNADHCSCTSHTMNPFITCANTFNANATRPDIISFRNSINCLDTDNGGGGGLLFEEDFESGFGPGWTGARSRVRTQAARTGALGCRIRRDGNITNSVSTVGSSTITLEYSRRTRNYDAGETGTIEWFDGFTWNNVETVGNTNNAWTDVSVVLPAAAGNNAQFRIRLRSNASQGNERMDVDDIRVIGS